MQLVSAANFKSLNRSRNLTKAAASASTSR